VSISVIRGQPYLGLYKPETRNPKPETRNLKPETTNHTPQFTTFAKIINCELPLSRKYFQILWDAGVV